MFGGSHQLSLVNVLTGRSDVSAVCDFLVAAYVKLVSGKDNTAGAVYMVKKDAGAPFAAVRGKEFVIIKSIPVLNPPVEVNSAYPEQEDHEQDRRRAELGRGGQQPENLRAQGQQELGLPRAPRGS